MGQLKSLYDQWQVLLMPLLWEYDGLPTLETPLAVFFTSWVVHSLNIQFLPLLIMPVFCILSGPAGGQASRPPGQVWRSDANLIAHPIPTPFPPPIDKCFSFMSA